MWHEAGVRSPTQDPGRNLMADAGHRKDLSPRRSICGAPVKNPMSHLALEFVSWFHHLPDLAALRFTR